MTSDCRVFGRVTIFVSAGGGLISQCTYMSFVVLVLSVVKHVTAGSHGENLVVNF